MRDAMPTKCFRPSRVGVPARNARTRIHTVGGRVPDTFLEMNEARVKAEAERVAAELAARGMTVERCV